MAHFLDPRDEVGGHFSATCGLFYTYSFVFLLGLGVNFDQSDKADSSKSRGSGQNALGPREKLCAMAGLFNQIFFPGSEKSGFKTSFSRAKSYTFSSPKRSSKTSPNNFLELFCAFH
jgi:hypothetical protein